MRNHIFDWGLVSVFALLTLILMACNGSQANGVGTASQPIARPDVDDFIVDVRRDPQTGAVLGPLESYTLRIDDVIDPIERARLRTGKLAGETVVFGLDGTGDTGEFHHIALERAAELFAGSPYETAVSSEIDTPGTLALVRFETPGYPSGIKGNADIPVYVIPLGNCVDITSGHIYPAELRCEKSGESMLLHPYGSFSQDEIVSSEWFFESSTNYDFDIMDERFFDEHGRLKPEALKEHNIPLPPMAKPDMTIRKYLLLKGFKLTRDTGWNEIGRDEIELVINGLGGIDDDEIIGAVFEALKNSKYQLHVERVEKAPHKILIIPSIRSDSVERLYDLIRVMRFDVRPKRQLVAVIDDRNGRIMIIGPKSLRKLLDTLTFPSRMADYDVAWKPSDNFRLVATPLDNGQLDVQWARLEGGSSVDGGRVQVENDIGTLLRLIYTMGCSVDDCALLLVNARNGRVLNVKIDLKLRPIDAPTGAQR